MIMRNAYLSSARHRPIQSFPISSATLDALMSSSNTIDDEKSSNTNRISTKSSSTRENQQSTHDESKSALRFTPSQLHKVHKRRKDSTHKSSLRKRSPLERDTETSRSRDHDLSSSRNSSKILNKDQISEVGRSTHISRRSAHNSETDSGLETYSSREEPRNSPYSILTKDRSSSSSRKSGSRKHSPIRKPDSDSDSEIDRTQNSSVYITPEGTPISKLSFENRRNSSFKRSFSDEQNEEGPSTNSSFNNSGYFTPESSPSGFNLAKRLKTRWSDTSLFSQDKSSYSNWRHNLSCHSEQGVQPELIGYQMVGDSQFCRFGQQLLGLERVPIPNSPGRIGICVSGQTITDLHRRVRENFYPISDKIILMIGTNDFLRNVDVNTMCEELSALVKTLQKSASNIILLTLPPIPKLEKKNTAHFRLLEVYNRHIRSLENGETLRIADVSPLYMTSQPYHRCKMHLFELYFGGPAKRHDLIHLNRYGLEIIRKYILDKFL